MERAPNETIGHEKAGTYRTSERGSNKAKGLDQAQRKREEGRAAAATIIVCGELRSWRVEQNLNLSDTGRRERILQRTDSRLLQKQQKKRPTISVMRAPGGWF